MLIELNINNFAIIKQLDLNFSEGLIIFTGETGAGKSIILDALEAVLGGRTDSSSVRTGSQRALLEGTFRLDQNTRQDVIPLLQQEGLYDQSDFVVMSREIRIEGRNIARINGRTVSASLQREIGAFLVDIHGQSEHLSLLKVRNHLDLLDRYANTHMELENYRTLFEQWRIKNKELHALREDETDAARRMDLLSYQINEIESARLQEEEEELIKQERTRLANAENLNNLSQKALLLLDEGSPETPAITDLLGEVVTFLGNLENIDEGAAVLFEKAELSLTTLSELSRQLRNYAESIEFNPRRLDQIEERINVIHNLKRKYGGSIQEVINFLAKARTQLENITHADERIDELEHELSELIILISEKASLLSSKRKNAATSLSYKIEEQLNDLRMINARFAVDMQTKPQENGLSLEDGTRVAFDHTGFDQVEFLVEPNPGEGLKPLVKIASGGETSRFMLALKNILANADTIPVLIFDEIDQGVGGRVGLTVGEKLWQLSQNHQVMCVTHLPQLAAFGTQHFHVSKEILDNRTQTIVLPLTGEEREKELAQMMGPLSEGTLQSAIEILDAVNKIKG